MLFQLAQWLSTNGVHSLCRWPVFSRSPGYPHSPWWRKGDSFGYILLNWHHVRGRSCFSAQLLWAQGSWPCWNISCSGCSMPLKTQCQVYTDLWVTGQFRRCTERDLKTAHRFSVKASERALSTESLPVLFPDLKMDYFILIARMNC